MQTCHLNGDPPQIAVLGVHRKVTQAGQTQQQKNSGLDFQQARSASPAWDAPQRRGSRDSGKEVSEKMDRLALSNPTLEAVGGNVVSTGLGALEILGKRAVDVISDVVPPRMNIGTMFEESGGKAHLVSLRSLASAASTRVNVITTSRPDFLNASQLDDLEQLLDHHALDTAVGEPTTDLLAGHKDFRVMVALLEQMGVQGTTHLRQLRNCTRKLSTLVPDNVNAFEQEWHNHQTRASEKDFFARGPIKKFFESRLLTVYFDGLRALAQFTDKTCDQILRLAENFNIRVAEKSSNASSLSSDGDDASRLATLALAKVLQQFVGSLIAETKFISKQYRLSLDAILQTAKGLTTPLDSLDWEDMAMGSDKIKTLLTETETIEAIGFVHSGTLCVLEVLRNDLMIDIAYGKVTPTPRQPRSRPVVQATVAKPAVIISVRKWTPFFSHIERTRSGTFVTQGVAFSKNITRESTLSFSVLKAISWTSGRTISSFFLAIPQTSNHCSTWTTSIITLAVVETLPFTIAATSAPNESSRTGSRNIQSTCPLAFIETCASHWSTPSTDDGSTQDP
ncbi:hypothetical protein BGW39_008467 [Mortierella sp. 14UC]|nr:hypothetical protein BGW39_008467 [Mortierella sp. 14UC]